MPARCIRGTLLILRGRGVATPELNSSALRATAATFGADPFKHRHQLRGHAFISGAAFSAVRLTRQGRPHCKASGMPPGELNRSP